MARTDCLRVAGLGLLDWKDGVIIQINKGGRWQVMLLKGNDNNVMKSGQMTRGLSCLFLQGVWVLNQVWPAVTFVQDPICTSAGLNLGVIWVTQFYLPLENSHAPLLQDLLVTSIELKKSNKPWEKIYDVPMKFACKLIHGGPVHLWNRPVTV